MDEALNRAFTALRSMNLRERISSIIDDPDSPPPTPQEQALTYIETHTPFKVDEKGFMWHGPNVVGEFDGVVITNNNVIIKTKMYTAMMIPLAKRKTHGS